MTYDATAPHQRQTRKTRKTRKTRQALFRDWRHCAAQVSATTGFQTHATSGQALHSCARGAGSPFQRPAELIVVLVPRAFQQCGSFHSHSNNNQAEEATNVHSRITRQRRDCLLVRNVDCQAYESMPSLLLS